jgi:glutathione S-transferase
MLKFYGFSKVNAGARGHTRDLRVLWALEEMQLPFEVAGMDHPAHDLNTEAYRRLSPFEQIPSIDDDGLLLSESGAILVYLAKKSGRLIPGDRAGEAQVLRWCFAAMNSVEPPLLVATKEFTVADILMTHVLSAGIKDEALIAPYPGVASYRDRCLARPAWKRTIEAYGARVEAG